MKSFPHIRRALAGKLWYVHEQKMQEIMALLEFRLSGGTPAADVLESIRASNVEAAARAKSASGGTAIAVLPIYGMIMHRTMYDMSGGSAGTSCSYISMALKAAVADPNVGSIVLDIDSPGGDVDGVDELASEIYAARKQKKITAVSNCLCASAAYYLAAQATEIVVSPSSLTGSIGVYTMHEDDSAMLDAMGIKLELIKFGENKAEGNSLGPLSDSAREHLQEMVDTYGVMFEKAVARGRGVKQDLVHSKFGQGRVFDAKQAVKLGLADRVGTLADVLGQGSGSGSNAKADESTGILSVDGQVVGSITMGGCKNASHYATGTVAEVPAPKADDGDCSCDCVPCDGGDCDGCTCEGCECEGCTCASATAKAKELSETRARSYDRIRHELRLAAAR
jgi:capsid assembly protease